MYSRKIPPKVFAQNKGGVSVSLTWQVSGLHLGISHGHLMLANRRDVFLTLAKALEPLRYFYFATKWQPTTASQNIPLQRCWVATTVLVETTHWRVMTLASAGSVYHPQISVLSTQNIKAYCFRKKYIIILADQNERISLWLGEVATSCVIWL